MKTKRIDNVSFDYQHVLLDNTSRWSILHFHEACPWHISRCGSTRLNCTLASTNTANRFAASTPSSQLMNTCNICAVAGYDPVWTARGRLPSIHLVHLTHSPRHHKIIRSIVIKQFENRDRTIQCERGLGIGMSLSTKFISPGRPFSAEIRASIRVHLGSSVFTRVTRYAEEH